MVYIDFVIVGEIFSYPERLKFYAMVRKFFW